MRVNEKHECSESEHVDALDENAADETRVGIRRLVEEVENGDRKGEKLRLTQNTTVITSLLHYKSLMVKKDKNGCT